MYRTKTGYFNEYFTAMSSIAQAKSYRGFVEGGYGAFVGGGIGIEQAWVKKKAWYTVPGFVVYIKAELALCGFLQKPQSSTKSLERQRKKATIHNSLRSIKQTAVWRLKPFPLQSHKTPASLAFKAAPRKSIDSTA